MLIGCNAHLIIELDGQKATVPAELKQVGSIVAKFKPKFVTKALGATACEKLWGIRREFSYALRDTGLVKLNQDIVVPRGRLEDLFRFAAGLQKKHGMPIACFGHAGDGNIHVNVMVDASDPDPQKRAEPPLDKVLEQVERRLIALLEPPRQQRPPCLGSRRASAIHSRIGAWWS